VALRETRDGKTQKKWTIDRGRIPNPTDRAEFNDRTPTEQATPVVDEYGEPVSDEPHEHTTKRPLYKRPALLIGAGIVLLIALLLGLRYWLYARSHETTDDAFIDGHIVQVSPKVSGYVAKVYITDNQSVKAGDLLVELDSRDSKRNWRKRRQR